MGRIRKCFFRNEAKNQPWCYQEPGFVKKNEAKPTHGPWSLVPSIPSLRVFVPSSLRPFVPCRTSLHPSRDMLHSEPVCPKWRTQFFQTNPKIRPGAIKDAVLSKKTNPNEPPADPVTMPKRSLHPDPAPKAGHRGASNAPWRKRPRGADFAILNSPFAIPHWLPRPL